MTGYSWQIVVAPEARRALAALKDAPGLEQAIALALDRENDLTVNRIQRKLSGEVLNVQTGTLRRSIGRTAAVVEGNQIGSAVGSGSAFGHESVAYAAIHEYGGTTKPHVIRARNAKTLAFPGRGGGTVFCKSVNHPGSRIPERSYIRSTLAERAGKYGQSLGAAILQFQRGGAS